jgi:hypothetical protein
MIILRDVVGMEVISYRDQVYSEISEISYSKIPEISYSEISEISYSKISYFGVNDLGQSLWSRYSRVHTPEYLSLLLPPGVHRLLTEKNKLVAYLHYHR